MKPNKNHTIAPIAIDFGAKTTGVYYAKYDQATPYTDIKNNGKIFGQELIFDKNNNTILLRERTVHRHTRRRYDRCQFAKRLLKVILKEYFKFPIENHLQAFGFLINRRGFTRIEGDFSREHLKDFPKKAWDKLPEDVQKKLPDDNFDSSFPHKRKSRKKTEKLKQDRYNFLDSFESLINEPERDNLKNIHCRLKKERDKVKKDLVFYRYVKKIKEAAKKRINDEKLTETKEDKLSNTNKWIIERLVEDGHTGLEEFCKKDKIVIPSRFETFNRSSFPRKRESRQKTEKLKQTRYNLLDYLNSLDETSPVLKQLSKWTDFDKKQKQAKDSIWNFKSEKFNLIKAEESGLFDSEHKDYVKTHLHHFCYAINKIYEERCSGSIHRSKFFEEIKKLFNNEEIKKPFDNSDCKHGYFKNFLLAVKDHPHLNSDKIYKLICHISNFELKPLRAYFNDINYRTGDRLDNEKLSQIFKRWCFKHWRVTEEKDGQTKYEDYKELKKQWKEHLDKNNVIEFWLKTEPELTIPPYQSLTNRRPPKCHSLLLNKNYMDEKYKNWREWLREFNSILEYPEKLKEYSRELESLKNKKNNSLVDKDETNLRTLQFILDRSKDIDPFKLNEIWSFHHKIKPLKNRGSDNASKEELKKYQIKLEKAKNESHLPERLKKELEFEEQGSFGHFLNKYYQTKKKARERRYFMHQEKKDKWSDKNKFLTVCPHKPRQKKYQMHLDLFSILGLSPKDPYLDPQKRKRIKKFDTRFYDQTKEDTLNPQQKEAENKSYGNSKQDHSKKIKEWLEHLDNKIKSVCDKSAKMQKKYKGDLKNKIDFVEKQLKEKLKDKDKKELHKLITECKDLSLKISKELWPRLSQEEQRLKAEKFNSIFSFAQIHNIVFTDRNGFSGTCPVCSLDNGFRMQKANQNTARASRLIGLTVRIIDGAVMRICEAVSEKVASACLKNIKEDLSSGHKITIPLILEQNRFEFEPSLKKLKGRKTSKETGLETANKDFEEKKERIKSNKICPYSGVEIGDRGEIDHIIPRTSEYGELNDEANLIYASKKGNQQKGKQQYSFKKLHDKYKKEVFNEDLGNNYNSYEHFKGFIYSKLEKNTEAVEKTNAFEFGKYINFSNLTKEQKIAFRHALFLKKDDPLRKKVIQALQNRNKTIVNGTQRYLAQCIADKIWKRVKEKRNLIEFDYFEYPSDAHHPKSISVLRKYYEKHSEELRNKSKGNHSQPEGSHLIDAHMAFLQAAEDHKSNGTMGIIFPGREHIKGGFNNPEDKNDSKILPLKVYEATVPEEKHVECIELNRKLSKKGYRFHRSFHKADFYADNYVPILVGKESLKAGFSLENSVELYQSDLNFSATRHSRGSGNPEKKSQNSNRIGKKDKYYKSFLTCLQFIKNKDIQNWDSSEKSLEDFYKFLETLFSKKKAYFYLSWDKKKIHKYLIDEFSTQQISKGQPISNDIISFLNSLSYKTKKTPIKEAKDIEKTIKENKKFDIKVKEKSLTLPLKKEWEKLQKSWEQYKEKKGDDFKPFLEKYFKNNKSKHPHQKARKVFSLKVKDDKVHYLQRRKSWNHKPIYQICADSESRKDNNKFYRMVFSQDDLKQTINKPFRSQDIYKIKPEKEKDLVSKNYQEIDPNEWFKIPKECVEKLGKKLPEGVSQIAYRIDNITRPRIKITLQNNFKETNIEKLIDNLIKNPLTKPKEKEKLKKDIKEALKNQKKVFTYIGSGFNKDIKEILQGGTSKSS